MESVSQYSMPTGSSLCWGSSRLFSAVSGHFRTPLLSAF